MGKHSDRDVRGTTWLGIMKQSPANDVKRNNKEARGDNSEGSGLMHGELLCLLVPVCQGKSTGSGHQS